MENMLRLASCYVEIFIFFDSKRTFRLLELTACQDWSLLWIEWDFTVDPVAFHFFPSVLQPRNKWTMLSCLKNSFLNKTWGSIWWSWGEASSNFDLLGIESESEWCGKLSGLLVTKVNNYIHSIFRRLLRIAESHAFPVQVQVYFETSNVLVRESSMLGV